MNTLYTLIHWGKNTFSLYRILRTYRFGWNLIWKLNTTNFNFGSDWHTVEHLPYINELVSYKKLIKLKLQIFAPSIQQDISFWITSFPVLSCAVSMKINVLPIVKEVVLTESKKERKKQLSCFSTLQANYLHHHTNWIYVTMKILAQKGESTYHVKVKKAYWGTGSTASHILDFSTRWRWEVSFTPQPLYPHGKSCWFPLDMSLGWPKQKRISLDKKQHVNWLASPALLLTWCWWPPQASSGIWAFDWLQNNRVSVGWLFLQASLVELSPLPSTADHKKNYWDYSSILSLSCKQFSSKKRYITRKLRHNQTHSWELIRHTRNNSQNIQK